MPPKLQVDESLAFMFICIEASMSRLDFKAIGIACDLQPAAARMRYTRLKKALEAGVFKGAILTQGPVQSNPRLALMANPESSRLAAEAKRAPQTPYADVDLVDDLDEEDNEEDVRRQRSKTSAQREKRKAAVDDEPLFFDDTSATTRFAKQIKREDDGEQPEEVVDDDEDNANCTPEQVTTKRPRAQNGRARKAIINRPGRTIAASFEDFAETMTRNNRAKHPVHPAVTEQSRSAPRNASPMTDDCGVPYGIASNQTPPTAEDYNFAADTGQSPIIYRYPNRNTQAYAPRGQHVRPADNPPVIASSSSFQNNLYPATRPVFPGHQAVNSSFGYNRAGSQASAEPQHAASDLRHPTSVFDNFVAGNPISLARPDRATTSTSVHDRLSSQQKQRVPHPTLVHRSQFVEQHMPSAELSPTITTMKPVSDGSRTPQTPQTPQSSAAVDEDITAVQAKGTSAKATAVEEDTSASTQAIGRGNTAEAAEALATMTQG
ncbi:hypothetical protein LTS08_002883 [Lithohypha guttulata]|nr:hypothetical protein LTS08_002883 [Lithohypha guttulata]